MGSFIVGNHARALLEQVLKLSPEDRALLVEGVMDTLDDDSDVATDEVTSAELLAELQRRAQDDPSTFQTWAEVRQMR